MEFQIIHFALTKYQPFSRSIEKGFCCFYLFSYTPLNSDTSSEKSLFAIKSCQLFNILSISVSFYCLFLKKDYNEAR